MSSSIGIPPDHVCEFRPLRSVAAPTGPPPEHTRFEVLICSTCRTFEIFPRTNYALTLDEWREMFVGAMAAMGFRPAEGL